MDTARAIAVAAMVFGHTLDGLLSDAARALPAVQAYWSFRGLTAPMFMFVSGWAVMASVARSNLSGWALARARLNRVGLLLLIGVVLRWPGWNMWGLIRLEPDVIRHLVGLDALHCIAFSLLAGAVVLGLTNSFWSRAAAVGAVAVIVPLASGFLVDAAIRADLPILLRTLVVADAYSPFALLPWIAYFFAGATAGHLITAFASQHLRALALFAGGVALAGGAWLLGLSDLPQTSPVLFAWRLGQVLLIGAFAMLLPTAVGTRLAPLGRSSLVVYVFHLPIVYGWSTIPGLNARYGRSLSVPQALAVGAVLLVLGLALSEAIRRLKARRRTRREEAAVESLPMAENA